MLSLKQARLKGKIEEFIKEHEPDTIGDIDKLDAAIKRPLVGTAKSDQGASKRDRDDD